MNWDALPRLLQELCDGPCMHYRLEVFALDESGKARRWYCRTCYIPLWIAAGRPLPRGRSAMHP